MAMFTSSEPAVFVLPRPARLTTPATPGDPLTVSYEATLANIRCHLNDGSGALIGSAFELDAPPSGVSIIASLYGANQIACQPSVFSGHAGGEWVLSCYSLTGPEFSNTQATAQWGGTIDALLSAAQNADSQSYRVQQTVQGNSTWDHTTGTVGITSTGESFQLADEAGTFVTDQTLGVRRINSTVG